jgi:hypothetical protein
MLRQEVYADDAEHRGATPEQVQRARTPYTVTEQNFSIRTLQPRGDNRHASSSPMRARRSATTTSGTQPTRASSTR